MRATHPDIAELTSQTLSEGDEYPQQSLVDIDWGAVLPATFLVVLAVAIVLVLIRRVRTGSLTHSATRDSVIYAALATMCGAGLFFMLLTDWPLQIRNKFWADHSVLASTLSSALVVGVIYFVYEKRERAEQDARQTGLTGAGLGAVVRHCLHVEAALRLIESGRCPSTPQSEDEGWRYGKPLSWMGDAADGVYSAKCANQDTHGCAKDLADQSMRRLLSGMREWAVLIGSSNDGTEVLLEISALRSALISLRKRQEDVAEMRRTAGEMRLRVAILAWTFEDWSSEPAWIGLRSDAERTSARQHFRRPQFAAISSRTQIPRDWTARTVYPNAGPSLRRRLNDAMTEFKES